MSSYYGVLFPEFWTGPTGRAIRAEGKDAQILACYLVSCRDATMLGLYRIPLDTIRFETGLGDKGLLRAFAGLVRAEFADYDLRTEHTWVREMAKFRLGLVKSPLKVGDKRVKGVRNLYGKLPDNPFLAPFFDRYAKQLRLLTRRTSEHSPQRPSDATLEGASKGLVSQITDNR